MAVRRSRIVLELLTVTLAVSALGATLASVVAIQKRTVKVIARLEPIPVALPPMINAKPIPVVPRAIPPTPIDPTPRIVAKLESSSHDERQESLAADARAMALESARQKVQDETKTLQRREMLARSQLDALNQKAQRLEDQASSFELERDVLAMERDEAKATLTKAQHRSSHAVMPHRGPNGTWQRPIVIECSNGEAKIAPSGPSFTLLELSELANFRGNRFAALVSRLAINTQRASAPDGGSVIPYVFFLVRPDGIRPFYEARSNLQALGIAFGYELIDQNWEVDVPNLENPAAWGEEFANQAKVPAPAVKLGTSGGSSSLSHEDSPGSYVWPTEGSAPPRAFGSLDPAQATLNRRAPGFVAQTDDRPVARGILAAGGMKAEGRKFQGSAGAVPGELGDLRGGMGNDTQHIQGNELSRGSAKGPRTSGGSNAQDGDLTDASQVNGESGSGTAGGGSGHFAKGENPPSGSSGTGHSRGSGNAQADSASEGDLKDLPALDRDPSLTPFDGQTPQQGSGTNGSGYGKEPRSGGQGAGNSARGGQTPSNSTSGVGQSSMGGQPSSSSGEGSENSSSKASRGYKESEPEPRPTRTLEILVVCEADGVILYPGAYKLTTAALAADPQRLPKQLAAILAEQELKYLEIRWRPSIAYKVAAGGNSSYWVARRQTILAAASWPSRLEIADTARTALSPGSRMPK